MSLQEKCQKFLDNADIPGAIIFAADRNGNTLCHAASGVRQLGDSEPMKLDTPHWIASCTKAVTALACLQLVEEGKVKLDDPVDEILPELAHAKIMENGKARDPKTKTTLRMLLTHTAGQAYEFFHPSPDIAKHFKDNGIKSFDCSKASISAPLVGEPGESWIYSTSLDWAGQLAERIEKKTLDEIFQEKIFKPLGIKNMTFDPSKVKDKLAGMHQRDSSGKVSPREHAIQMDPSKIEVQYGGAGLFANSAEYCQILVALLNDGVHPKTGGRILKKETVDLFFAPQLKGKLVDDLEKPYNPPLPEFSNPFVTLEGVPKNWCFGGCMTPEGMPNGRGKDSYWWAGIANHYYFVDRSDGSCGMIQAQVFPFFDVKIVAPFFFEFEPLIHEEVKRRA